MKDWQADIAYGSEAEGPLGPRDALDRIHALLDGSEWDSDTTEAISVVVLRAGYTLSGPDEYEDES